MGYTTDFTGKFNLDKPLSKEHLAYLLRFSYTRRIKRNATKTEKRLDPLRIAVGLPVGDEGAYFVNEEGDCGQGKTGYGAKIPDVVDYNAPPQGQPGLWCQWVPGNKYGEPLGLKNIEESEAEATTIVWDEGEKFYYYVEWLHYLIENFLGPWGYVLNGNVVWQGEEADDRGRIVVDLNIVKTQSATFTDPLAAPAVTPTSEIREAIKKVMTFTERKRCPKYVREAARRIAQLAK